MEAETTANERAEYSFIEYKDMESIRYHGRPGHIWLDMKDGRCKVVPCDSLLDSYRSTVSSAKEFLHVIEENVPDWKRKLSWQWQELFRKDH